MLLGGMDVSLVAAGAMWVLMQLLLGSALQGYEGDSQCTHSLTH